MIDENIATVRSRIETACRRAGRDPGEIKLVAVSKTHPAVVVREAMTAGLTVFGENKVQEAEGKITEIGREAAQWHLIGHLQSNKARKAVQLFDLIHSVDSLELATRLERICEEDGHEQLPILIEVDLAGEETKAGIAEADLAELVNHLRGCKHVVLEGLMVLP